METVYDVLFRPGEVMGRIADERLTGQALIVFAISAVIPAGGLYFGLRAAGMAKLLDMAILLHALGSLVVWFVGAAVLHLIAEFYGGEGSAAGLFAAMGFAQLPRIFAAPLWAVTMVLPKGTAGAFLAISTIVLFVWMLALDIAAIRGAYNMGGARAALVLVTPFLALAAVLAVVVIFAGAAVIPGRLG